MCLYMYRRTQAMYVHVHCMFCLVAAGLALLAEHAEQFKEYMAKDTEVRKAREDCMICSIIKYKCLCII